MAQAHETPGSQATSGQPRSAPSQGQPQAPVAPQVEGQSARPAQMTAGTMGDAGVPPRPLFRDLASI